MRLRLLIVTIAACALLIPPASASAAFKIGISENSPNMFTDPLFTGLGAKYTRAVVPWDFMTANDGKLQELQAYVAAADAQGVQVLVSFEHSRGDASLCFRKSNFQKPVCRIPKLADYETAIKAFLAAFPTVKTISPWNEINHFTQGTSRDPRAAARFTDKVRQLCPGCTIVAADVLDQADNPSAKHPTFRATSRYIKRFRSFLKTPRTVCGIHDYSDVNRFHSDGTRALIKALGCKQIWLTETGGLYKFGSFWTKKTKKGCKTNASCQLKATKYMFSLAKSQKKVKRLYIYTWFGAVTPRFDAGLVANGKPRPAYNEVKKRLG
jgi:Glycosyl hydrolase catalytic core